MTQYEEIPLDSKMYLLASGRDEAEKSRPPLTAEAKKDLRKLWKSQTHYRLQQIDGVLFEHELPLDFSLRENLETIDVWLQKKAILIPNEIILHPKQLEPMKLPNGEIITFGPYWHFNPTWRSIVFDLGIKLGETVINKNPNLKWEIDQTSKLLSYFNTMVLVDSQDNRRGIDRRRYQIIYHMVQATKWLTEKNRQQKIGNLLTKVHDNMQIEFSGTEDSDLRRYKYNP